MSKIGILQPVYNAQNSLENSISSILNQSYKEYIYVLIDDGSTDNSLKILKKYSYLNNIKIISKNHSGLPDSLNIGLEYLNNKVDFIARMDSDDTCDKQRLEKQINFLENNKIDFCSTWSKKYDKNQKLIEKFCPKFSNSLDFKRAMLKMNFVIHGSVLFRSTIINSVGYYPNEIVEDYNYWMKILDKHHGNILCEYLYNYFENDESYTSDKGNLIYNEAKKCREYWSEKWKIKPENEYKFTEELI